MRTSMACVFPALAGITSGASQPIDLLIITHEAFAGALVPLKNHKDYTGIATEIVTWQALDATFHAHGRDEAERIKKAMVSYEKNNGTRFRRGDVNTDGRIDIADAIAILGHLFAQSPAPACVDAADTNDDGVLDIADPIKILAHLFAKAGPLPAPFESCGLDPTPNDKLGCKAFKPCQ